MNAKVEKEHDLTKGLIIVLVTVVTTAILFLLWVEQILDDFYHWGPPFKVGSIVIETWWKWWLYVGLLVSYQVVHVYIEETIGRETERKHTLKIPLTSEDIFIMACYNFYKAAGTILHILVAVTRVDVWLLIALVDTIARVCIWNSCLNDGRKQRLFYRMI